MCIRAIKPSLLCQLMADTAGNTDIECYCDLNKKRYQQVSSIFV